MNLENFPECTAALLTYTSPNPAQVKEPTCGVRSSGSRGSTNTAVQIWHTGFLISYLLCWPGSSELSGKNYPLLSCVQRIRQGKKKKEKSFSGGLSNVVVQSSQLEYGISCLCITELCTQSSFGVCDCCWASWDFIKIPDRSGCIENLSPFWLDFGRLSIKLPKFLNLRSYREA